MTNERSPHYQQLYNRGIMYLNSGEYKQALDAFEKARNVWDSSYPYSGMGRAYYGLERYKEALACFERAYTIYRGNLQAAHWRAKALGKLGRYDEAAKQFESVLKMLSNNQVDFRQEVLADYREMKDRRGRIDSTRSHGRNTSGISGKKAQDYEALGRELKTKGEYEEAVRAFDKAIEHGQTYFAYHRKGECLMELGKDDEALKCFEEAIRIDKKHHLAYYGAGRVYFKKECFEAAKGYFVRSVECNKESVTAWYWLGKTHMKLHHEETAIKAFQNSLASAVKYRPGMVEKINTELSSASEYKSALVKRIEELEAENKELREKLSEQSKMVVYGDVIKDNSGIIAKDDAVVNRANINQTETNFCPGCSSLVEAGDLFCRKCGRKLT